MPYDYPCQKPQPQPPAAHCSFCQEGYSDIIIRSRWAGSTEPQVVYELFFSPKAVNDWTTYMKGWRPSLRYSGVFVHRQPYCTFNQPRAQPIERYPFLQMRVGRSARSLHRSRGSTPSSSLVSSKDGWRILATAQPKP